MHARSIGSLFPLLIWQDEAAIVEELKALHVERLAAAFKDATTRLVVLGHLNGGALAGNLRDLSGDAFCRLLYAPEMCAAVTAGSTPFPERTAKVISDWIETELALQNDLPLATEGRWTALGDYLIASSMPPDLSHCLTRAGKHSFRGPRVGSDIPIDCGCSNTPFYAETNFLHAVALNPEELLTAISKIETALAKISEVSRGAYHFVAAFTKGLLLQKHLVRTDQFWSWSSGAAIGRSVLVNPHLPAADASVIAEAIVHEAIHNMLCTAELEGSFVADFPAVLNCDIVSPWTGARLKLAPFLHACLVWFGLWGFWSAARGSTAFFQDQVERRIAFTAAGFYKGPLLQRIEASAPYIRGGLCHLITEAQLIVLAG
jgi:hypothetical protein